jgi:hypothetical protein
MKKIKNYSDLIAERKRLEQNLIHQKVALKHGFSELKSSLKPMSVLKDLLGIEKGVVGSFTGAGINAGIDMVVRHNILAKAGFLARILVPFALKTIVNVFTRNKTGFKQLEPNTA